jgi:hypothetical protein
LFIALTAMSDVSSQLQELAASLKDVFSDPIKGFGVLSDYARRQAGIRTRFGQQKGRLSKVNGSLAELAPPFEENTRALAQAVDRILRKHGRSIIGKQFASRRLADIMIDMFVLASVLSRVSTRLSQLSPGEARGSAREQDKDGEIERILARDFAKRAQTRIRLNFEQIDDNDDELLKSLAEHAVGREGYPWDVI